MERNGEAGRGCLLKVGTTREKLIGKLESRVSNAALLAEVIYKAAYSGKIDVSTVGASCEVLHEYLDSTWDMVSGPWAE